MIADYGVRGRGRLFAAATQLDEGLDTAGIVHFALNHYDFLTGDDVVAPTDGIQEGHTAPDIAADAEPPVNLEEETNSSEPVRDPTPDGHGDQEGHVHGAGGARSGGRRFKCHG